MSYQRPVLADIAEQISTQVLLLKSDTALSDLVTVRARLEAIQHFASQGLNFIEERRDDRPAANRPASVE
jgi:hypothetical protein